MTKRLLFVCLGNICRSPTAEGVMRHLRPDLAIDSAGTAGWHAGKPPYAPMIVAAARRGVDLSGLRARQVVADDFNRFDLILAMDDQNLSDLEALRPPGNQTALHLLLDYAPDTGLSAVPDPYYTRDFDQALDLIETALSGLSAQLK